MPLPDSDLVARATNNYVYKVFPVELHVGNEVFKVASSRLTQHSSSFRTMFSMSRQPVAGSKPIILESDVDEFKDFLWFIHADPFAAKAFFEAPPSAESCLRLLGIANVAYQYGAPVPADLAVQAALEMLTADDRPFPVSISLALRLIRIVRHPDTCNPKACVDVICDAMYPRKQETPGPLEVDPITVVELAKLDGPTAANKDILAHAYFYVLAMGAAYWKKDERLTAVDRQRLLCGSHALYSPHEQKIPPPHITLWSDLFSIVSGWNKAKVHADIAHRRRDLWSLFDHESWRLTHDVRPDLDWAADSSSTVGEWGAEPERKGSAEISQWLLRQSSTSSGSGTYEENSSL